jgi:hypothetical protein
MNWFESGWKLWSGAGVTGNSRHRLGEIVERKNALAVGKAALLNGPGDHWRMMDKGRKVLSLLDCPVRALHFLHLL